MAVINQATDKVFKDKIISIANKIKEIKLQCESNIVMSIYANPDEIHNCDIFQNEFSNNIWRVYFVIAYDILVREKKLSLDDITIGFYLKKHPKLQQKYDEYGGYSTIQELIAYIKEPKNISAYITEFKKWNTILKLYESGLILGTDLSFFADKSIDEIYSRYEVILNSAFVNAENDIKSYDITDGLDDLIDKLDDGISIGLPYSNMDILNKEIGGQILGNITLVGGLSNVGKSTFARTCTIPSIIEHNEKVLVMINEDSVSKWQRELLVWVANNILKTDLQKYTVRSGNYSTHTKEILKLSADWIKENTKNHNITIIPFKRYSTSTAIKLIKKYSNLGVKYFILDTFKLDAGSKAETSWLSMQQGMVDIQDTIKEESCNVHILITFQLGKGSVKQRYYTQDNIGMAKNIIDPVSTCLMIRDLYPDEYTGEARELKVYQISDDKTKNKVVVKLDKRKRYQIVFMVKNREGSSNVYQIVFEHDLSRNVMKEIGVCSVPIDF